MTDDLREAIERAAYDAWPAAEVSNLGGWRLRFMHGVTRRANSVWLGEASGSLSLRERMERTEQWYASRGRSAAFQLGPFSKPAGIDSALDQLGYRLEAPVSVQVASSRDVAVPGAAARVDRHITEPWFELSAHRGRFAKSADSYRGLLGRLGQRARFALAEVDGVPAGVGLGVIDGTWMGVFSMLVLPLFRRRGAARAVLSALATSAQQEGATRLYLQVERDNDVALALYRAASFVEVYEYHCRVK